MNKKKSIFNSAVWTFLLGFSIVLTACGSGESGGGGESKTEANLNVDNAPKALSAATGAIKLLGIGMSMALGDSGGLAKANAYSVSPLRSTIDKVLSISKDAWTETDTNALRKYLKKGNESFSDEPCPGGGTVSANGSWDRPIEQVDESGIAKLQGSVIFKSCKEGTEVLNGSLSFALSGTLDDTTDDPAKLIIAAPSFTYTDRGTANGITMRKFAMVLTGLNYNTYDLAGTTITLAGNVSGNVVGEPIDAEFDNFKIAFNSDPYGDYISISGSIRDTCLDGWITITTNDSIFIPKWAYCPTRGEVIITAGGDSIKATIESDTAITVFLNHTQLETYDDCEEVEGLCGVPDISRR